MALEYVMESEKRTEAMNWNVKTRNALRDLRGLLVGALCVARFDEDYTDTSEDDKRDAIETLLEFSRGSLEDATEGHEEVWRAFAHYVFAEKEVTPAEPETEQAEASA